MLDETMVMLLERKQRPRTNEVVPLIEEFYKLPDHGAGGNLHCELDDGNISNANIKYSITHCMGRRDKTAELLARVLDRMTLTQRRVCLYRVNKN